MAKQNIINKLKERYDWRGYWISSVIASIGAFFLHLMEFSKVKIEILLLTFLFVWVAVFILMILISELLKDRK
ncbi:hypothetical protein KAR52_01845 [Candidatus Pacearchaeota archaeon]|nr:hypothetical protein [Candidatus Pacearchaeota archaeon]